MLSEVEIKPEPGAPIQHFQQTEMAEHKLTSEEISRCILRSIKYIFPNFSFGPIRTRLNKGNSSRGSSLRSDLTKKVRKSTKSCSINHNKKSKNILPYLCRDMALVLSPKWTLSNRNFTFYNENEHALQLASYQHNVIVTRHITIS